REWKAQGRARRGWCGSWRSSWSFPTVFEFGEVFILHRPVAWRADAPVCPRTLRVDVRTDGRVQDRDLAHEIGAAVPLARELEDTGARVRGTVVREAAVVEDE